MGTLDRYAKGNSQFFHVTHYDLYKGNNPEKFIHDVAILHLDRIIPDDVPAVAPIALSKEQVKTGTICHVTGWGLTEEVGLSLGSLPSFLKHCFSFSTGCLRN